MTNVISISNASNVRNAMDNIDIKREMSECIEEEKLQAIYFPVEEKSLYTQDDKGILTHKAIVRGDNGNPISVVGDGYKVITNEEVFASFNKSLLKSGLNLDGLQIDVDTSHNMARSFVRYRLPSEQIDLGGNDTIDMQFLVRNSYDGSSSFTCEVGGWRALCSNGMVIGQSFAKQRAKHTKNLKIDPITEKLRIAAEFYQQHRDIWLKMTQTPCTSAKAEAVFKKMKQSEKTVEFLKNQYLKESLDLGHTVWALYNALTYWSTHRGEHKGARNKSNEANSIVTREAQVRKVVPTLEQMVA